MIAQVVFDLPLQGPFDYLVPVSLESQVAAGQRVRVFLGRKKWIGMVTALLQTSDFQNLKPIQALVDQKPLLDQAQMELGHQLSRYYGCSLGEALFTVARGSSTSSVIARSPDGTIGTTKQSHKIASLSRRNVGIARNDTCDKITLYVVPFGDYQPVLISLIQPVIQDNQRVLILVPDQFVFSAVEKMLQDFPKENYIIGTRSLVFRSLSDITLVVMIDEDNPSYKQEQTPMYETREVLLMRVKKENIRVAFVSTAPSVELMHLVENGVAGAAPSGRPNGEGHRGPLVQVIDLNNYKVSSRWFLSPPVWVALESNLKQKINSLLVVNHTLGLQQLQKALQEKFPSARICIFKRPGGTSRLGGTVPLLKGDILVGTSALLRFKYQTRLGLVVFLDIDGELNRLQMRSCFRAWSLARHFRAMAQNQFLIQTRHLDHYVIKSLAADDDALFYSEDMRIRKELEVSPFGHQIAIYVRSVQEKVVQKTAQEFYQVLTENNPQGFCIHAPVPEGTTKRSRQYRLNILVQGAEVIGMITMIKEAMTHIKRSGKVIMTLNVDP